MDSFQDDFEVYSQLNSCQLTQSLLQEPITQSYCAVQYPTVFDVKIENYSEAFEFSADGSVSHRDGSTLDKDSLSVIGKRSRPNDDFDGLSEKDKLERNRICARECRKRKKMYIKSLELQMKSLKSELIECRRELSTYKLKEQEKFFGQFSVKMELPETPNPTVPDKQIANSKRLIKKYIVRLVR
jgi:hypothetical protein